MDQPDPSIQSYLSFHLPSPLAFWVVTLEYTRSSGIIVPSYQPSHLLDLCVWLIFAVSMIFVTLRLIRLSRNHPSPVYLVEQWDWSSHPAINDKWCFISLPKTNNLPAWRDKSRYINFPNIIKTFFMQMFRRESCPLAKQWVLSPKSFETIVILPWARWNERLSAWYSR